MWHYIKIIMGHVKEEQKAKKGRDPGDLEKNKYRKM